jgi:hypothetical protein
MRRLSWPVVGTAVLALRLLWGRSAAADAVPVPASVQATLTAKLLASDRGLSNRANGAVRVLVLIDPSEGQSQKIANEFATGMKGRGNISSLPVEVTTANFDNANSVAARIKKEKIAAVYLSAGLARSAEAIAVALKGVDVMTVAAEPSAVIRGIAVGFDLLSGQPKVLVNLSQAKMQNVQLPASVLSLAINPRRQGAHDGGRRRASPL